MKFNLTAEFDNHRVIVETNDVSIIYHALLDNATANIAYVYDGYTGEALAIIGTKVEHYYEDNFTMTCLGCMTRDLMGY